MWGKDGLTEVREYLVGADCIAKTTRTYATKTLPGPAAPSTGQALEGLQRHLMAKQYTRLLAGGSTGAAVPAGFLPAALTDAAKKVSVPQWMLKEDSCRRIMVDYTDADGDSCSARMAHAALFTIQERSTAGSWSTVDTFSTALREISLVPVAHSLTGDALRLCRGDQTARWELLMCVTADKTMWEAFSFTTTKYVILGFDDPINLEEADVENVVTKSTRW